MKKLSAILTGLCLTLCLTACSAEPTPSAAPTEPLFKTVYVHTSITQEFGSTVSRTEFLFDEQDHVTEVVVYTNDTETKRHNVECDENGNYIKWLSDGSVTEYTYDEQGNSLGVFQYLNDKLVSATEYTWENSLRTSVTTTMATQGISQRITMTYDSNGHLLRHDSYTADTLNSYSIYATGEDGRICSVTAYQPDGTLLYTSTCTWDGSTETVVSALPDGTVKQTMVLTYDEHGNLLTQESYDSENKLYSREIHTWKAVEVAATCPRASV